MKLLKKFQIKDIQIKTLPNLSDIIEDKLSFSDIKDFLIEDLLDREQVEPDNELIVKHIKSKTILVTGAGGTIGAELSRQILKQKPKKLILFELNEFALFKIYEELGYLYKNLRNSSFTWKYFRSEKIRKHF